jgi:Na+/proline symporter
VITMSRQVGLVLGVSILVAVLGTSTTFAQAHAAFQHGWWAIAAMSAVGMFAALGMTPRSLSLDVKPVVTTFADEPAERQKRLAVRIRRGP